MRKVTILDEVGQWEFPIESRKIKYQPRPWAKLKRKVMFRLARFLNKKIKQ
jgi:hypothetical protein